ncbi:MAG: bifunctional ornithine acetyltransferase/N-acetylglutamate synthase [Rickettsiales bacterium]|nr:bifunctional ornithine acetyltransferase/N-acetylglutamate synthase [Rickettsiales bacterium]OUV81437.1 MAG: bifunctional ornithine acetyltransferase/N-acetylglutamate synthase [Rickettsiales bacterium TMED131]
MKKISEKKFPKIPALDGISILCGKAQIKSKSKLDLALIIFDNYANVAYVSTTSKTCAANIQWLNKNKKNNRVKVLVANSGNANAYTGKEGYNNVLKILNYLSSHFICKKEEVIVSSTGVIGEQLPIKRIMKVLNDFLNRKNSYTTNWKNFATSILTTDTFAKAVYKKSKIGNNTVNIIGIAKGSGMIAPNMATMLGYIFTDAALSPTVLGQLLTDVNEKSFNSITVDSDTSTNDMVCFFSTKKIPSKVKSFKDKSLTRFRKDLENLSIELAKKIICDGEGATKLIEISVKGAKSYHDAKKVAMTIANSPLVKTAIAGEDANWGRIIMAVGKSNVMLDQNKLSLSFGKNSVIIKGELNNKYNERIITTHLKGSEIKINLDLNLGTYSSKVWTCDLTKRYIEINADYRS